MRRALAATVLLPTLRTLRGRWQRGLDRTAQAQVPGAGPRPPVVYLRNFAEDREGFRLRGELSQEEQLARVLSDFGPVVALRDPGEHFVYPGASRIEARDDNWPDTVSRLLDEARLVVVQAGRTPALDWEMREVRARVPPERVLLIGRMRDEVATSLRSLGASALGLRRMPRVGFLQYFILFATDWTPCVLPVQRAHLRHQRDKELEAALRMTLRDLYYQLGEKWSKPPITAIGVVTTVGMFVFIPIICVGVAVVVALLIASFLLKR